MTASIRIAGPVPMDVAGTLMRVIGTVYPGTTLGDPQPGESMVLNIADEDRGITPEVLAELAELKDLADAASAEMDLLSTDGASLQATSAGWLARILVPASRAFLSTTGAENYIEQEVIDPTDEDATPGEMTFSLPDREQAGVRYVFSVARSPQQTPHELRTKAERELEELRATVLAAHTLDDAKQAVTARK